MNWTTSNTKLNTWFERNRSFIGLETTDGETIADWWDEDVHAMFESGYFVSNKGQSRLHQSVVEYANEMGIVVASKN